MASCNGAQPSTSAMCTSSLNMGLHTSDEWRTLSVNTTSVRLGRFGTNCFDNLCAFGYGTEDGAFGPLSSPVCDICANVQTGTSRCQECSKNLCNNCSTIHISQYMNHHITHLVDSPTIQSLSCPSTSLSLGSVHNGHSTGSPLLVLCDKHREEALLFCRTCRILACKDCSLQHGPLHSVISVPEFILCVTEENKKLLKEAQEGIAVMVERQKRYSKMQHKFEENKKAVVENILNTANRLKLIVDNRVGELMIEVNKLYAAKKSCLSLHQEIIYRNSSELQNIVKQLTYALNTPKPSDLISVYKEDSVRLKDMQESMPALYLCERDELQFVSPDQTLYSAVQNYGLVCTRGCACKTVASGKSKTRARANSYNTLKVNVHDHQGNLCMQFSEKIALTAQLLLPNGRSGGICYVKWSEGTYIINYFPRAGGIHYLHIQFGGHHIVDSPFMVKVTIPRNYDEIGHPDLVFGEEGGEDGQLCRPWGVCCDIDGNIIIADRSNNRVQIFRPDGTFYRKFGKQGSEAGEFDRPAGIASDDMRRIIVADKDNHRIQVFKTDGEFLFMFGEKGSKQGQFNYPWDVDVNSEGQIIVTDTRNHRIQLFSANGSFIRKFGYENHSGMWKHFDSPRGVCFGHSGEVIVTDFNNHCIVVLDSFLSHPRFVGKEGTGPDDIRRPQGICIDEYGHIIISDSKNHRIQIFESNGRQLRHFGTEGINPGQLDRPSGICVSPDGKIIVVDFGNTRIQVF